MNNNQISERLKKDFKLLVELNKEFLIVNKQFIPVVLMIKGEKIYFKTLNFNDTKDSQKHAEFIKIIARKYDVEGYIFALDANLTQIDRKTKEVKKYDCLSQTLFTPQGVMSDFYIYDKDFKMIKDLDEDLKDSEIKSRWDAWDKDYKIDSPRIKKFLDCLPDNIENLFSDILIREKEMEADKK